VVRSPSGVLYIGARAGSGSALAPNGRPSISTRSPPLTDMPTWATSPLTLTRPSAMRCSSARREPRPACASTLWRRSSRRGVSAALSSRRLSVSLRLAVGCCSLMFAPGAIAIGGGGAVWWRPRGRGVSAALSSRRWGVGWGRAGGCCSLVCAPGAIAGGGGGVVRGGRGGVAVGRDGGIVGGGRRVPGRIGEGGRGVGIGGEGGRGTIVAGRG